VNDAFRPRSGSIEVQSFSISFFLTEYRWSREHVPCVLKYLRDMLVYRMGFYPILADRLTQIDFLVLAVHSTVSLGLISNKYVT
jgi:hypothetical protein